MSPLPWSLNWGHGPGSVPGAMHAGESVSQQLEEAPFIPSTLPSHKQAHIHAYAPISVAIYQQMDFPKRVSKYKTAEERKQGLAEKRKAYDRARVYIGSAIDDWEEQKQVCGGTHCEFAAHLLSLHRAYCSNFRGFQASQQEKSLRTRSSTVNHQENSLLFQ